MLSNYKGLSINKCILHIINSNGSTHKSNILLPNTNSDFDLFLKSHIKSALTLKCRKTVSYRNIPYNISQQQIQNLFHDEDSFIEASKKLTDFLAAIVISKGLKPLDLIVCEYMNDDEDTNIAIMLLEYTKQFYHNVESNSTQIEELTTLASSESKFKKCAIFNIFSEENEFDGIVTDRNESEFFIKDFLGCKVYENNREATERFIAGTLSFINEKRNSLNQSIELNEKLNLIESQCITSISENRTISIDGFIDSNFNDELETFKEEYKVFLRNNGLVTDTIIVDDEVSKDFKYNKYKLDNDIEIKVPVGIIKEDEFSDLFKIKPLSADSIVKKFEVKGTITNQCVKSR